MATTSCLRVMPRTIASAGYSTEPPMSKRARHPPAAAVRVAAVPPLYHFGVRLFALFTMAMVIAFWPSYFSRLADQPSVHHHAHGLAMTAWLALLIAQASL